MDSYPVNGTDPYGFHKSNWILYCRWNSQSSSFRDCKMRWFHRPTCKCCMLRQQLITIAASLWNFLPACIWTRGWLAGIAIGERFSFSWNKMFQRRRKMVKPAVKMVRTCLGLKVVSTIPFLQSTELDYQLLSHCYCAAYLPHSWGSSFFFSCIPFTVTVVHLPFFCSRGLLLQLVSDQRIFQFLVRLEPWYNQDTSVKLKTQFRLWILMESSIRFCPNRLRIEINSFLGCTTKSSFSLYLSFSGS